MFFLYVELTVTEGPRVVKKGSFVRSTSARLSVRVHIVCLCVGLRVQHVCESLSLCVRASLEWLVMHSYQTAITHCRLALPFSACLSLAARWRKPLELILSGTAESC